MLFSHNSGAPAGGLLSALTVGLGAAFAVLGHRTAVVLPALVATPTVDGLVEVVVTAGGCGLAGWVAGNALLALVCALAARAGRRWTVGESLVARYAPAVVRRLARVAAGAGVSLVLTAPVALAATPAAAANPGGTAPLAVVTATTTAAPSGAQRAPSAPDDDGTVLDLGWRPTTVPRAELADRSLPAGGERLPTVRVVPGDTLWDLARARLGGSARPADVAAAVARWHAENAEVIGPDPDLLRPGAVLTVPQA